jgi:ankyrin repeat protein
MDQVADDTNTAMMHHFVDFYLLKQIGLRAARTLTCAHIAISDHCHQMTESAAFEAIGKNDLYALTAALDAGTEPNASAFGTTLLIEATSRRRLRMVDLLLSRGADVHRKDGCDQTALHWAASGLRNDVLFRAVFSAAGPRDMNLTSCQGMTPLHCMVGVATAEQMAFALSHPGIGVYIRNIDGRTPLDMATSRNLRTTLQTYGDQEARWQPMRYLWIRLLMIPTRR